MMHQVAEARGLGMQAIRVAGQSVTIGIFVGASLAAGGEVGALREDEQLAASVERHQVVEGARQSSSVLFPATRYVQEAVHLHYPTCAPSINTIMRRPSLLPARIDVSGLLLRAAQAS
jgi:hypothetical protein